MVSFHKYPRYFVDIIYVPFLLAYMSRKQGLKLGKEIIWYGIPIVSMFPYSKISIGKGCSICSRSSQTALGVNHQTIFRTLRPGSELRIGNGVRMSGTTICAAKRVVIGDRCVIGANVTIVDTDFHSLNSRIRSSPEDAISAKVNEVEIGCDVFIGGGSYILKGVKIGDGAVIGAASVVSRDVGAGIIVAGNPAREIVRTDKII
jgi:acetyltransferase-like isoleucine patch superfamily enzyme